MRSMKLSIALAVSLCALAFGLDGKNGYSSTRLFRWGDIRASIQYDSGFTGVEWADIATSHLGGADDYSGGNAVGPNGDLFYLVTGSDQAGTEYTSLIAFDGSNQVHLLQAAWVQADIEGESLRSVAMSDSDAGRLTSGHPVVMRWSSAAWGTELVSVDPASGGETIVHTYEALPAGGGTPTRFAIGGDGRIYALYPDDDSIGVLSWNGSGYTETTLNTNADAEGSLRVGPDGLLYTFNAAQGEWYNATGADKQILRINPDSGAYSVYGYVKRLQTVGDWAWDSDGTLWVALRDPKNGNRYIAPVPPGGVTSSRDAVCSSGSIMLSLIGGPNGELYALESPGDNSVDRPSDDAWKLSPSSDSGGGEEPGGGGGKGGGKGKNK